MAAVACWPLVAIWASMARRTTFKASSTEGAAWAGGALGREGGAADGGVPWNWPLSEVAADGLAAGGVDAAGAGAGVAAIFACRAEMASAILPRRMFII